MASTSYGSVFIHIQDARANLNDSICGTIVFLVYWILSLAIPIASITIGLIYIFDCTVQPLIPIFLIVFGGTSALQALIGIGKRLINDGNDHENIALKCFVTLLQLFVLAWFIAGSVWVFQVYPPEYDNTHLPKYCNYVLYSFAFYMLLIIYGFMI